MTPMYEYKCPRCGEVVAKYREIAERNNAPMCGDCLVPSQRTMAAVPAHFKGTGWGKDK